MNTEKQLLQKYTQFLRQSGYLIGLPKNVIKGYVGEFLEAHPEQKLLKHSVMQGLLSKCPHCHGTGLDPEIPNYDNPPNSSPTVADGAAGKTVSEDFYCSQKVIGLEKCSEPCIRCKPK